MKILKATFSGFSDDECPGMAASLAYYTTFSLPSLLMIIVLIVGAVWGTGTVERQIEGQFGALVGESGARQIGTIIQEARRPGRGGPLTTVASAIALLLGATAAFAQLQTALNKAWEVEPDQEQGGLWSFLMKRVLSFGMILAIAFLLMVSLALSALLGAAGDYVHELLPGLSTHLLWTVNELVSLAVVTLLFAAIFKWIPDAVIEWRDVWLGAVATAVLFVAGKLAIGLYIGQAEPGDAFGAAGSLVVIMLWIYWASLIVLLGAEFTQAVVNSRGGRIVPEKGAVKVIKRREYVRGGAAAGEA